MAVSYLLILTSVIAIVSAVPPFPVDNSSLESLVKYYFACSYTYKQICGFLWSYHGMAISFRLLKRLLRRMGLRRRGVEAELPNIVAKILHLLEEGYNNLGHASMWKLLNIHCGIRVTRRTVRLALNMIDPVGVYLRSIRRLHRRTYYTRGPNHVIHIDGYDKLKPFGIAIHGAIDGFSRKILWLKAGPSNNNPRYIAQFYVDFLGKYNKLPLIIRSDAGTENVFVCDIQRALRFDDTDDMRGVNSFLTGKSSANQRIERLWCSLRSFFTQFWRNHLIDLREVGIYHDTDPLHVECMRYCFLPIIQEHLDVFVQVWNSHSIRRQRDIVCPTGKPDVLYFQPDTCGAADQSLPLPVDIATIRDITSGLTEEFPARGCCAEFLELMELMTGRNVEMQPVPKSVQEAKELFSNIISIVDLL